ncbi:TatD family hydrolase [Comamonas aquatica]|uniref:TatD family hydrolase n=1 Tax=Comamonas aquatica TaxID=225991 RepID=UPI0024497D0B|nr:TatD family hydrolase [Comamonas aquatica]MDH0372755.1 TatD family hydrolase [Comamonas aquatica]
MISSTGLVDFHCHLDLYPDHAVAVRDAEAAGVFTLAVTTTPRAWPRNHELAQRTKHVRAALGLHPQLVAERENEIELWDRYLAETRYIGEVGLDAGPRFFKSLDAQTRAELFFARRVIFVEGAAELMLVSVLAEKCGHRLREHGVSLISVEGLNFDSFLPLFGEKALKIPVAVITDADPVGEPDGDGEPQAAYPAPSTAVKVSDNTAKMKEGEDAFVKVFHGLKTFEYDLALHADNRVAMLTALKELHPKIGETVAVAVEAAEGDAAKARALFSGMFERPQNNVQKGRFGQALAQVIADGAACVVPDYIRDAITHACQVKEPE